MRKRGIVIVVCLAACSMSAAAGRTTDTNTALERAFFEWDRGDYVAALTTYQEILAGPDAASALETIALQTGELYRTTELTRDGANPTFPSDGRRFSFETGPGIVAGAAVGRDRTTHVRAISAANADQTTLSGGDASFCPGGRHVAYLRVNSSPELAKAEALVDEATTAAQRTPRVLALKRLMARTGQILVRDLETGADRELNTGALLKTAITCAADDTVLFAGAAEDNLTSTQIYAVRPESAPETLTQGDGFKIPSVIDASGRTLLFLMPRQSPFRMASETATAGSGGKASLGSATFGLLSPTRKTTIISGFAPALSRDGRTLAWIERSGPVDALAEQRLVIASTAAPETRSTLHKGSERLDAPALAADGARVAFQMISTDDWEIFVIDRGGEHETRVTREIQHDVLPQFLTSDRLLAVIGEPRHRRSYVYEPVGQSGGIAAAPAAAAFSRRRLFHNNTVRTIAPEYAWAASSDGSKVLIVAERDGNTVSPERGVYLTDLSERVTVAELRDRVAASLKAERELRDFGRRTFAPIAEDVRRVTSEASTGRIYAYEKALFDFDSKHITRPGNRLASEYLFNQYKSFGYEPEYQWFAGRGALGGQTANVIATLKGTVNPELVYVVSSHYDSVAVGPGADDDSSGTAALLETARVLAGHPMPATIVFASFTGEEAGLLGSREFVRRALEQDLKVVGALNNDMIGWANDHRLDDTIRYSNPGIRDIQHAAAIEFSNLITYDALYYKNTDAGAYYEAYGDIVGGIGSYPVLGNPHYHQPHDLLEGINHQLITEVSKTTTATLMLLASSPSRIRGLQTALSGESASISWTPSPEAGITAYIVTWGPPENPSLRTLRVTEPRATLEGAGPGTEVRVKAINAKGMEGWDWVRTTLR
jgi:Peptidase family M28/Fibronectin type III domain